MSIRIADLSDESLTAIHRGAEPVPWPDRRTYYNRISSWLDSCALLTPVALREAIRSAQRELLRSPAT
jgi:hypothetical protein